MLTVIMVNYTIGWGMESCNRYWSRLRQTIYLSLDGPLCDMSGLGRTMHCHLGNEGKRGADTIAASQDINYTRKTIKINTVE